MPSQVQAEPKPDAHLFQGHETWKEVRIEE